MNADDISFIILNSNLSQVKSYVTILAYYNLLYAKKKKEREKYLLYQKEDKMSKIVNPSRKTSEICNGNADGNNRMIRKWLIWRHLVIKLGK